MKIITDKEYQSALKICNAYRQQQRKRYPIMLTKTEFKFKGYIVTEYKIHKSKAIFEYEYTLLLTKSNMYFSSTDSILKFLITPAIQKDGQLNKDAMDLSVIHLNGYLDKRMYVFNFYLLRLIDEQYITLSLMNSITADYKKLIGWNHIDVSVTKSIDDIVVKFPYHTTHYWHNLNIYKEPKMKYSSYKS